mgnify:CR=1 FL=1|jgi:hypothetical protein
MTGFDKILERLNQLEDRMQDLEDAIQIDDPEDDLYSTEIIAEDAYPECDCEEVCEECDA